MSLDRTRALQKKKLETEQKQEESGLAQLRSGLLSLEKKLFPTEKETKQAEVGSTPTAAQVLTETDSAPAKKVLIEEAAKTPLKILLGLIGLLCVLLAVPLFLPAEPATPKLVPPSTGSVSAVRRFAAGIPGNKAAQAQLAAAGLSLVLFPAAAGGLRAAAAGGQAAPAVAAALAPKLSKAALVRRGAAAAAVASSPALAKLVGSKGAVRVAAAATKVQGGVGAALSMLPGPARTVVKGVGGVLGAVFLLW